MMRTLLVCIFLTPLLAFSQTPANYLDYYPIEVGSYWEYVTFDYTQHRRGETLAYRFVRIARDTTLANGKTYAVREEGIIGETPRIFYERLDEIDKAVYRSSGDNRESKIVFFDEENSGDVFIQDQPCWVGPRVDTILGMPTLRSSCSFPSSGAINNYYRFAENIGWVYLEEEYTFRAQIDRTELVYARVRGQTLGVKVGVEEAASSAGFTISAPAPHPVNAETIFRYTLSETGQTRVTVHDIFGSVVATIESGMKSAGAHLAYWDSSSVPAGMYFCRLQQAGRSTTVAAHVVR